MKGRSIWIAVACASIVAIALPATAGAATKTVIAGPPGNGTAKHLLGTAFLNKYQPDVNDFFLHRVTIHQGDTVSFRINGFHTVDLPGSSGQDLPLLLAGATVSGDKDAAGNPFWFNGRVPSLSISFHLLAAIGGSTYNGSKRVASGLFTGNGNPPPYPITFTKAGTFKYFCDIHPGMVGYVVVKPTGTSVPTAGQDAASLASQVKTAIADIRAVAKLKPSTNNVALGSAGPNGVEAYAMFPARLSVKVGATVTFSMTNGSRELHTASFGPAAYLIAAANSLTAPAPLQHAWYASDRGTITLAGSKTHGNGFVSTGILDSDRATPQPFSSKIKFTKAGTYNYICLIHPFMKGTIVVH